jgi:hypothetical protein
MSWTLCYAFCDLGVRRSAQHFVIFAAKPPKERPKTFSLFCRLGLGGGFNLPFAARDFCDFSANFSNECKTHFDTILLLQSKILE